MKSFLVSLRIRILAFIVSLFSVCSVLNAQEDVTLKELSEKMSSSCVELSYKYTFRKSGINMNGDGHLVAQGLFWRVSGNGIEMYCDSKSVWVIDPSLKEVVIEPVVSDSVQEYEVNPAMLLLRLDEMFRLRDSVTSKDGKTVTYILDPVVSGKIEYLNVMVLKSDSTISQATIALKDGDLIKIEVSSMKLTPRITDEAFRPQRTFDSTWIVTDLR